MEKVYLRPRREDSILRFHPWVFSGAIAQVTGTPAEGDLVGVYSSEGEYLATGHYQIGSIMVRVLSFDNEEIDQHFYEQKLAIAKDVRQRIGVTGEDNNTYRLVHGEGDNLPGLVIDIYGNTAVMQAHSVGMHLDRHIIAKALKTDAVADNLLNREFEAHGPRAILLTDITYIINGKAPRCYMSTIIDACTKELLAWVLSESLEIDFVLETVEIAIANYGIEMNTETMIHSDQGAHYTSVQFRSLLKDKELRQSMSRRANCWDNAPQESFYGHMKDEIDISECETYEQILAVITDWADYYNNERYQWDLAKLAPAEYYKYLKTGKYPLEIPKSNGQK